MNTLLDKKISQLLKSYESNMKIKHNFMVAKMTNDLLFQILKRNI